MRVISLTEVVGELEIHPPLIEDVTSLNRNTYTTDQAYPALPPYRLKKLKDEIFEVSDFTSA